MKCSPIRRSIVFHQFHLSLATSPNPNTSRRLSSGGLREHKFN
ncbi:MAG: hypothetical protein ACTS4T_01180 [Candidatus Hodgkinia cicadicola]